MKRKVDPISERLTPEIEGTLESFGYELVQLKVGGRAGGRTLSVYMDKPGGVTVGDCKYMASRLSVLLDVLDPIEGHYTLAVSSPGINRPLTKDSDFERFVGQKAAVRWSEPTKGPRTVRGTLKGVHEGRTCVEVDGAEVLIPLADIETANILYDWEQEHEQQRQGAELSDERGVP